MTKITEPYLQEDCLKTIDEEYVSDFDSESEYFIKGKRVIVPKIVEPYIYDSKFTMEEIEQFLCNNAT